MVKAEKPSCIFSDTTKGNAQHTFFFFKCMKWQTEREALVRLAGALNADNNSYIMLPSVANWKNIADYLENVLRKEKR